MRDESNCLVIGRTGARGLGRSLGRVDTLRILGGDRTVKRSALRGPFDCSLLTADMTGEPEKMNMY